MSVEKSVRGVLGPQWSLEILFLLQEKGPLNYSDIEAELSASSDQVTDRLQHLETVGIIDRTEHSPIDVQYAINPEGEAVIGAIKEIATHLNDSC